MQPINYLQMYASSQGKTQIPDKFRVLFQLFFHFDYLTIPTLQV